MIKKTLIFDENYSNKAINYKWNNIIESKINVGDHGRLIKALYKINQKAVMGLGIAASEWIIWRLINFRNKYSGITMDSQLKIAEAHWMGLIDKRYIWQWNYKADYIENNIIETPIWNMTRSFVFIRKFYDTGNLTLYREVSKIIILARHISEDYDFFDSWLTQILRKAARLFPIQQLDENGKWIKNYDSSREPFIPRDFYFNDSFDYESADVEKIKCNFILSVNHKENQFLTPPEEMIAKGFKNIPYQCGE